jgi:electron transfer flavoprotein beta subunit
LETLEMDLPGVVTVTTQSLKPRYVSLAKLGEAFGADRILTLDADALGLDQDKIGQKGSRTRILRVYSPTAMKKNLLLTGAPKDIVEQILKTFSDRIGGAIGKDLQGES